MYRFCLPDLLTQPATALALPPDQSHHARNVLRLDAGDSVLLFDGQGHHAPAILLALSKRAAMLKLTAPISTDPPPNPALTIAVAVPKADRADWLIEQASQLNVTAIQWLSTDRTVVKPKEGGGKLEKHHRLAIESAKQSHRTHLLQIAAPVTLEALLGDPRSGGRPGYDKILWLDPAPENSVPIRSVLSAPGQAIRILALVGPEGGWSPREHTFLEELARQDRLARIRLTPTILRIETAAAALAAIVMSA